MDIDIDWLDPHSIVPLHDSPADATVEHMRDDMLDRGWVGRSLLIIETDDAYQAWTGSHRLAAACAAGLEHVPCYIVAESAIIPHGVTATKGHVMDYERAEIMSKVGDEIAEGLMLDESRLM